LFDEWNATGAVLAGRRTVEQVDHWGGDHHGVPIFVPSHRPPGPSVASEAGVLDELQIHQVPVLFGRGRRLFELLPRPLELEIVRVIDTPEATHVRYRVRR
jgi:dihydrofolate reductase